MAKWKYRVQVSRTKDGSLKFVRQYHVYGDYWKTEKRHIMTDWLSTGAPQWVDEFVSLTLCYLTLDVLAKVTPIALDCDCGEKWPALPLYLDPSKPLSEQE